MAEHVWPFQALATPALRLMPVQVIKPGRVTTPFGRPGSWQLGWHPGDDWNGYEQDLGAPIRAGNSGRIVFGNWGRDYGIHAILEMENGHRQAYCHMSKRTAKVGDRVLAGEVLGYVGMTGNTTGPHCHVEERVHPYHYAKSDVRKPSYAKILGG